MTDQLAPAYGWYPLLGERARYLNRDGGPCAACGLILRRGQRVCDKPDGGPVVHTACADKAVVSPAAITASNPRADETRTHKVRQQNRTPKRDTEHRSEAMR